MKKLLLGLAACAVGLPVAAADVGVSIGFDQPGVYGRIDIGRVPQPPVVLYPQPLVIAPTPVAVHRQPIYLHVPPGHAKNWRKHCGRYHACAQPVYFVQQGWYRDVYAPAYHGWDRKSEKQWRKLEKERRKHEKKHHRRHHHDDD